MSAYGTKKPLSDLEIQLGFPTNFEDAYAEYGQPLQFAPRVQLVATPFAAGTDEQAQWHQQKMMDAHRRVMNAVADTKRSTQRALVSHAGYWAMPKPVLAQRVFANPSLGSGAVDIYKPIHRATPELTGGVLRSKQGQEYGQRLLQARIAQLNAIDEAAAGLQEGMPITDLSITQDLAAQPGTGSYLKLSSLLNNLNNALASGITTVSRFDVTDFQELALLLFRVVPQSDREELQNILEAFDVAAENAREALEDLNEAQPDVAGVVATPAFRVRKVSGQQLWAVMGPDGVVAQFPSQTAARNEASARNAAAGPSTEDRQFRNSWANTIATSVPLLREYVKIQMSAVNDSPRDRLALSKNTIRSLGITRWVSGIDARARAMQSVQRTGAGAGRAAPANTMIMTDRFTALAPTREDEIAMETGVGRFNRDERQVFGDNSGRWYGQEYEQEAPTERGLREVSSAARNGIRNPFRAPGAAADARGEREFEEAVVREAPMMAQMPVVEQRKARMAAVAAAQQAAREAAKATMSAAVGKGRSLSSRIMMRKGGMDIADQMTRGMTAPPPTGTTTPVAQAPTRRKAPTKKAVKLPTKLPARGSGKPKLFNSAGKAHRGAFHQMPDGTYMSGAKHSKRSKPLTVA
jgi:hypothetical protein